ncbi:hypothetical protein EAH75_18010 [Rhodanobacter glycinis]|uniref:hypothetical protein n=1 Tax=Rhodanobacter glycinis TaxID=582702 RepID=UPI00112A1F89|nr:hypothetical protein [Rhodanobacter glycinis]TPG45514.1 hypothetical protein EAH75_18010 [Rhodanobacter glycinis]
METFDQLTAKMTPKQKAAPATYGDLMRLMQTMLSANKLLKQRIERIEARGVKYCGTWQRSGEYERGDLATHKGSMWHAVTSTREEPGASSAWQLAVKAGRDGRSK